MTLPREVWRAIVDVASMMPVEDDWDDAVRRRRRYVDVAACAKTCCAMTGALRVDVARYKREFNATLDVAVATWLWRQAIKLGGECILCVSGVGLRFNSRWFAVGNDGLRDQWHFAVRVSGFGDTRELPDAGDRRALNAAMNNIMVVSYGKSGADDPNCDDAAPLGWNITFKPLNGDNDGNDAVRRRFIGALQQSDGRRMFRLVFRADGRGMVRDDDVITWVGIDDGELAHAPVTWHRLLASRRIVET